MNLPPVVSATEWQAARDALLAKEKEATKAPAELPLPTVPPEVQAKQDAAVQWCRHATHHTVSYGGKPWSYLLIPHDAITGNMTIVGLASQYRVD